MKVLKARRRNEDTLVEQVYQTLRNEIITGRISGGSRLVESALAEEMKVSRTPVREALHRLAVEGFLYSIPRAGYIVEEMSDYDIVDLFTIRLEIELLAAKLAYEKITPVELERMELNLKMTYEKVGSGHTEGLTELDVAFHNIIYKSTRSKTMVHICQSLSDHSLKYRISLIHIPEFARKTRDGHYEIFRAFVARDFPRVEEAIKNHLQLAKEDILKIIERNRDEAFFSSAESL